MFRYETCCVLSTDELITELRDSAEDVTEAEFRAACEGVDDWAVAHGYDLDPDDGLTLSEDWHVSWERGTYDGRPCFFLTWSGIEFVWTDAGEGSDWGYGSWRP